jgi:acyl-CoA thioesterase-1
VRVDNRAVYGAKVADVLATQLPVPADADVVTLCVGSNDAGRTDPEEFRQRLRQACAALPAGSLVGDVPEFQWGPRVLEAAALSTIVREVVAEFPDLLLARVEEATAGTRILTELAGDFFHPGDRGHARIARAFVASLALAGTNRGRPASDP